LVCADEFSPLKKNETLCLIVHKDFGIHEVFDRINNGDENTLTCLTQVLKNQCGLHGPMNYDVEPFNGGTENGIGIVIQANPNGETLTIDQDQLKNLAREVKKKIDNDMNEIIFISSLNGSPLWFLNAPNYLPYRKRWCSSNFMDCFDIDKKLFKTLQASRKPPPPRWLRNALFAPHF